jgi:uncharacterized protein YdcH (DUF465 family)
VKACVTVALDQAKTPSGIQRGGLMMMKEEEIKEHLMSANPEFRQLVEEHKLHEGQLTELLSRHHMTEQDHVEEIRLKKKKLQLKDQMNSMIQKFRNELSHQHS